MENAIDHPPSPPGERHLLASLALVSAISLFLELVIIRWLSTEIRIFSHVKNMALIACFVGLALGYPLKRFRLPLWLSALGQWVLLLASLPPQYAGDWTLKLLTSRLQYADVYEIMGLGPWQRWLPGGLQFLFAFFVVIVIFLPLGQRIGELFRQGSSPLRSYTYNVAASLLGVLAFTGLSLLRVQPVWWFAIGYGLLLFLTKGRERLWTAVCVAGIVLVAPFQQFSNPSMLECVWSPYQKVQVWEVGASPPREGSSGWRIAPGKAPADGVQFYMLDSNDIAMMWMLDMSDATRAKHPWLSKPGKIEWYDYPYHLFPQAKSVLIIGSGSGNDIAAALRHNAAHVDAVEIDPVIAEMGRKYNPEHPYSDPRVTVHITDGRYYMQRCTQRYDLVVFGQLDNTDWNQMSNLSNIRMDSYIYTVESMKSAYALLNPGGLMVVNFGPSDFWGIRVTRMLQEATGQKAIGVRNEQQYQFPGTQNTFVVGDLDKCQQAMACDPQLKAWMSLKQADWDPQSERYRVTDDWPYWYLARPAIPPSHLLFIVVFLGFSLLLTRFLIPSGFVFEGHYWALGAAFTLLETHLISKTALLFGSTWMVNGFVIAMVLVMILLANAWVEKLGPPRYAYVYPALLFFGFLQWLLPPGKFLALGPAVAGPLALTLYTIPVLCAGLIFARGFRQSKNPDQALTANLSGAVTGGFLEPISYITGMSSLMLLVLALYALSWLLAPRKTG